MVHKKFGTKANKNQKNVEEKQSWYDRAPPKNPTKTIAEMVSRTNGNILTHEQEAEVREKIRDEISKRMGELLLKGHTMLDQYCQSCSGIIMECRNGVQQCVTCQLYDEYKRKEQNGSMSRIQEIPLDAEDLESAPHSSSLIRKPPKSEAKAQDQAPEKPTTSKFENVPRNYASYVDYDDYVEEKPKNGPKKPLKAAKSTISSKIEWAAGKLENETNPAKILELLEILKISAETLKAFQNID